MFISQDYANKLWTNHERHAAQARAFHEASEYILPARFDDTEIPGVLPTVGYISLVDRSPEAFVSLIVAKLNSSGAPTDPAQLRPPTAIPPATPEASEEVAPVTRHRLDKMPASSGEELFSQRFAKAFPGVRGEQWFENEEEIASRLTTFFAPPIKFIDGHVSWWFRGGSCLHIENFEHIEGRRYLMDINELNIGRVCAVNQGIYYRCWIYVETLPDVASGAYPPPDDERRREIMAWQGYIDEEFGLVDDGSCVTRAEYDDGATVADGKPIDLSGRVQLRARYLTPYNFILAPNGSPINNPQAEQELAGYLNALLRGEDVFDDMAQAIRRLPRRR